MDTVQWQVFSTEYKGKRISYALPVQEGIKLEGESCCGFAFGQTYDFYKIVEPPYHETGSLFTVQAASFVNDEYDQFGDDADLSSLISAEKSRMEEVFLGHTGEKADRFRNIDYSIFSTPNGTDWIRHSISDGHNISLVFQRPIAASEVLSVYCSMDTQYAIGTRFGGMSHPKWLKRRVSICEQIVDSVEVYFHSLPESEFHIDSN